MYTFLQKDVIKITSIFEVPCFILSILLAESFYKFGSFTLVCLAFLFTWYLTSFFVSQISILYKKN